MEFDVNSADNSCFNYARKAYIATKNIQLKQKAEKNEKSDLRALRRSLLSFFCLGVSAGMIWAGFENNCKTEKKNNVPAKALSCLGILFMGGTIVLTPRLGCAPWHVISYHKKWRQHKKSKHSVSMKVFDMLDFKGASQDDNQTTPYSLLDRKTLEEKTKLLDMSELTQQQQREMLQMIIDTCEAHPAIAKMFREEIFPTRICVDALSETDTWAICCRSENETTVIQGQFEDLLMPDNFMHEYLHVVQDTKGLFLDDFEKITDLADFIAEANAKAITILCQINTFEPLCVNTMFHRSMADIRQDYAQGKIEIPDSFDAGMKKRILKGRAEEKTIGRLMEMLLSFPYHYRTLYHKACRPQFPDIWENNEAVTYIEKFHSDYGMKKALNIKNIYPNVYAHLLNDYSEKLSYKIEPINTSDRLRYENEKTHGSLVVSSSHNGSVRFAGNAHER